jgi:hypothetical protein
MFEEVQGCHDDTSSIRGAFVVVLNELFELYIILYMCVDSKRTVHLNVVMLF